MNSNIKSAEFKVIVPHNKLNKLISYPGRNLFYTKNKAIKVMELFERKCLDRVKSGHKLEIWAESDRIRFTLQDWKDDFMGVRTEKD